MMPALHIEQVAIVRLISFHGGVPAREGGAGPLFLSVTGTGRVELLSYQTKDRCELRLFVELEPTLINNRSPPERFRSRVTH